MPRLHRDTEVTSARVVRAPGGVLVARQQCPATSREGSQSLLGRRSVGSSPIVFEWACSTGTSRYLHCRARCQTVLDDWQGVDGPCVLLVWQQGLSRPVGQRVDADSATDPEVVAGLSLPDRFIIYTDCPHGHRVDVDGSCVDGTWTESLLRNGDPST